MEPLFPTLPEDLAEVSDEDLAQYITETRRVAKAIADGDSDVIGDRTDVEVDDELTRAVADIKRAQDEQAERETVVAERQERAQAAIAEIVGPEDEETAEDAAAASPVAEQNEPTVEAEAEPDAEADAAAKAEAEAEQEMAVAAAASRRYARQFHVTPPARAAENEPVADSTPQVTARLIGESQSFERGSQLRSAADIGLALHERLSTFSEGQPGAGAENVRVARIDARYDSDDHRLVAGASPFENYEKAMENALSMRRTDAESLTALVASGGLCAPVTPYYELQDIGDASRPVRDSLPTFNADRGGIQFAAPPTLAGISTAVGVRTQAQDAAGSPAKTVQTIACPSFSTVYVSAIFASIKAGVFNARTFPEQTTQFQSLVRQAWARLADGTLLDGLANAATYSQPAPTAANSVVLTLGMMDFLAVLGTAGAAIRSRHRMAVDATLQCQIPEWVLTSWEIELDRGNFFTENTLVQELNEFNIAPNFYKDSASVGSPGQVVGAQSAGAMDQLPTYADCYLYPAGSVLALDNGTLDIGVVRDSSLVSTNDFQIFSESFEGLAFVGQELQRLRIGVNPSGAKSLAIAVPNPALTAHA